MNNERANEDLLFRKEVIRQFEYFYQYMHGDRKEPDDAETILKRSINFFDADWMRKSVKLICTDKKLLENNC